MNKQILLLLVVVLGAQAHVRMMEPPCRACLWRFPEYAHLSPEPRKRRRILVWEYPPVGKRCGVCGDDVNQAMPRDTERGGRYWRDVNVRTYNAGETIPLHLTSNTQNHGGGFEVALCSASFETEQCFEKLVLGNGETFWPMTLGDGTFNVETTVKLPEGVRCESCTLRAHYRGAQNWGTCDESRTCTCDPNSGNPPGGMGCSEQQTFRSCSDIKIV